MGEGEEGGGGMEGAGLFPAVGGKERRRQKRRGKNKIQNVEYFTLQKSCEMLPRGLGRELLDDSTLEVPKFSALPYIHLLLFQEGGLGCNLRCALQPVLADNLAWIGLSVVQQVPERILRHDWASWR